MTPISVTVHWSESGIFPGEEVTYTFAQFEALALRAALSHENNGGYFKTKITVHFSNEDDYHCRLDLARHDDRGFRDHMLTHEAFVDHPRFQAMSPDIQQTYLENLEFARRIDWP